MLPWKQNATLETLGNILDAGLSGRSCIDQQENPQVSKNTMELQLVYGPSIDLPSKKKFGICYASFSKDFLAHLGKTPEGSSFFIHAGKSDLAEPLSDGLSDQFDMINHNHSDLVPIPGRYLASMAEILRANHIHSEHPWKSWKH